ncbi:hypothetical protein HBN50_03040 [Halobacteriovorax sp. GB3]|uniref:hypothetical protein n=1 Tax=Halobacteriovorax sp. GB3 TaxID=2719615 RepID=UPI0023630DD0|nr:hypothetical protein [Halobacteriovorax sp. GB3]MDD0852051.1 hypothetical protein [Halobacteriovorax sp. GB3]
MKLIALTIGFLLSVSSFANLQVFPTKIELSTRAKAATVTLRNKGSEKTTYKVSAVFYRQDYMGRMVRVDSPKEEERSIINNLRFSPRRVVLAPGQEQVVRFMVRKTAKLESGDYRAHIRFEPIKKEVDNASGRDNFVMMKVDARVAINVPVIYSKGRSKSKISLEKFHMSDSKEGQLYSVVMKKEGPVFPFGTFKVFKVNNEKEELVSLVNGVSSYVDERLFSFQFTKPKDPEGKYEIRFYKNEYSRQALAVDQFVWKK